MCTKGIWFPLLVIWLHNTRKRTGYWRDKRNLKQTLKIAPYKCLLFPLSIHLAMNVDIQPAIIVTLVISTKAFYACTRQVAWGDWHVVYSGTCLLRTHLGQLNVSWLKGYPHFRGSSVHISIKLGRGSVSLCVCVCVCLCVCVSVCICVCVWERERGREERLIKVYYAHGFVYLHSLLGGRVYYIIYWPPAAHFQQHLQCTVLLSTIMPT